LGPFYDEAGVRAMVGEDVDVSKLLMVETGDGVRAFPAFQFEEGVPLPGLEEILAVLRADGWMQALWLKSPSRLHGGRSSIELLRNGEFEVVLDEARRDSDSWSR